MKSTIDRIAARELELFANNDQGVYCCSIMPVCNNMIRKLRKGTFDREKAVKGFMYCVDYAAKTYCKMFGGVWYQVFNKATRELVAETLLENFLADNA